MIADAQQSLADSIALYVVLLLGAVLIARPRAVSEAEQPGLVKLDVRSVCQPWQRSVAALVTS